MADPYQWTIPNVTISSSSFASKYGCVIDISTAHSTNWLMHLFGSPIQIIRHLERGFLASLCFIILARGTIHVWGTCKQMSLLNITILGSKSRDAWPSPLAKPTKIRRLWAMLRLFRRRNRVEVAMSACRCSTLKTSRKMVYPPSFLGVSRYFSCESAGWNKAIISYGPYAA